MKDNVFFYFGPNRGWEGAILPPCRPIPTALSFERCIPYVLQMIRVLLTWSCTGWSIQKKSGVSTYFSLRYFLRIEIRIRVLLIWSCTGWSIRMKFRIYLICFLFHLPFGLQYFIRNWITFVSYTGFDSNEWNHTFFMHILP